MAKRDQVAIVKKGAKAWNMWRQEHPDEEIDLFRADLRWSYLSEADLREAVLNHAKLDFADLRFACLRQARLWGTDLRRANLGGVDLSWASVMGANLSRTELRGAIFDSCSFGHTNFVDVDLSTAKGLETARHFGPSSIDIHTIYRSNGNIPDVFLRGAGTPEDMIGFIHALSGKAIQYYSSFISYSSKDAEFVHRLHADLQSRGLRVWFAPDDMRIGDRLHETVEAAVHQYDKLMLVLSENSIESAWVEHEVKAAFAKEKPGIGLVLFPLRLDDAVMNTTQQWAHDIKRNRHIGDFSNWKDHDAYQKAFERLLRDLKAETPH